MNGRSLALVLLLTPALPALAEDPVATRPETRMALTGDFIELGTGHPGIPRSHAAVEIVNRSPHPVDVKLGYGAGRIEPGKTLYVRIEPGQQPLEVSSPALPGDQLAATLTLQSGRAYALGLTVGEVLLGDAVPSRSLPAAKPAADAKPASASTSTRPSSSTSGKKGASWKKKTKSGRVDIGRKRKKDR